jgi:hypothetical protein
VVHPLAAFVVAVLEAGAGVLNLVAVAIGVTLAVPGVSAEIAFFAGRACGATSGVGRLTRLELRLRLLGLGACLGASAARNVGLLAVRVPPAARDLAVVEADGIAQLVELLLRELARVTDAQVVERQVRERDALELVDAVPERLDHAVDLAVLALVDRDRDPRVLALARQLLHLGGERLRPVVELDAVAQPLEVLGGQLAVHLDVIRLGHVAGRREETRRELAVVGEQQDAFRVEVEAPHRLHRHGEVRQIVHHRRPTAIVRDGGDAGLRLVEQDVERVERDDGLAIEVHLIDVGVDLGAQDGDDVAVDGDASCCDQILGFASGGNARSREVALQAHELTH